ncbi:MAG: hypothetical protein GX596_13245, partial [Propionibacterium sp.]|nr:hypothetical protein [Propionibacterium sp.]
SVKVVERLAQTWERPTQGVFLAAPPTWRSAVWAGLLSGGDDSVVGEAAAAHLHGVLRDAPRTVTIWTPSARRDFTVGPWQVRFRRGRRRATRIPRRSSLEVSIVDMARDASELELVDALARALANNLTTPERLLTALGQRQRVRHSRVIREMCEASSTGIESALEWLFDRNVIGVHRLPKAERQGVTGPGRVDLLYDEAGLVVELDGMRDHADWSHDMFRDNDHVLEADRRTLRYGFNAANGHPCRAAAQLRDALHLHAGGATFQACPRCA